MVLRRHRVFMFFSAILPIINFVIFCYAIGRPLAGIHLTFNLESSGTPISCPNDIIYICNQPSHSLSLLCHIKHQLEKQEIVLDQFKDAENAVDSVHLGQTAAALRFPENLTIAWSGLDSGSDRQDKVRMFQDRTNRHVAETVELAVN